MNVDENMWKDDLPLDRDALLSALRNNICVVTFRKINGDNRIMKCSLKVDVLPPQLDIEEAIERGNPDIITVYDLDRRGWRSFRFGNIMAFSVV